MGYVYFEVDGQTAILEQNSNFKVTVTADGGLTGKTINCELLADGYIIDYVLADTTTANAICSFDFGVERNMVLRIQPPDEYKMI